MQIMRDSPIRFPGLLGDWTFTPGARALNVGHGIYWYGVIIALGVVVAVLVCMGQRKRYGITEDDLLDTVLWGLPLGVIGARLYYVIFYLSLYRNGDGSLNWGRIVAIWDGGLAIYGGVIAALLTVWAVSRRRKFRFLAMMDLVVIGLLIGQAVGRWGNFMNREAFGTETTLPWRMELITTSGEAVCVHPTFLYESLWNVLGLILLLAVVSKARHFDGENTCFYFLWYGFGRFWIEGLRTDSLYLFDWELFGQRVRVSQALSLVVTLCAAALLFYHLTLRPHKQEELFVNRRSGTKDLTETDAAATDAVVTASRAEEPNAAESVKEEQE